MRRRGRAGAIAVFVLAGIVVTGTQTALAAEPPPWLREAALSAGPALERNVPALVLHNEERVTIEDDGRVLTARSYAARVLTRAGRAAAAAAEVYLTDTGRVRDLRAWLLPSTGNAREFEKDEIVDVALVNNDLYNESRMKRIAAGDAEPGSVFGYESLSEDRAIFSQFEFQFQNGLPSLLSRFVLTVPNGWRVESVTFNHEPIKPVINGSTYAWELQDLPYVVDEPASPELSSLVPRVAVSVFPAAGSRATGVRTFADWRDVSTWLTELNDPQVILSDELVAKAKSLTAGAASDYDRIGAIGRFVQAIQYVSIQTGVGRGGGYRPRASADVLTKAYGDCKDKANLMRAMLKAVGITSYPVAIYSGDPDYVREEWASPQQFNHAVIAIAFSEDKALSSVLAHSSLGPLMIFDPTDPETPVGELPDHEQGSLALIVAGERGGIARMPSTMPGANRLERTIEAALGPDGSLTANVRERSIGHSATTERRAFRAVSRTDYESAIEAWVARSVTGATVSNVLVSDNASAGGFSLQADFTSSRYGQLMQNRLLIFKPAIVSRRASLFLTDSDRRHPIVLPSQAYTETVRIQLPSGFQVDEAPDAVHLKTQFGTYSATHTVESGALVFTRLLTLQRSILPADQYDVVRGFYERILAVEQAPAVLIRK